MAGDQSQINIQKQFHSKTPQFYSSILTRSLRSMIPNMRGYGIFRDPFRRVPVPVNGKVIPLPDNMVSDEEPPRKKRRKTTKRKTMSKSKQISIVEKIMKKKGRGRKKRSIRRKNRKAPKNSGTRRRRVRRKMSKKTKSKKSGKNFLNPKYRFLV